MRFLSEEEQKLLSEEELFKYYEDLRKYYRSLPIDERSMKMTEIMSPLIVSILKLIRKKKFVFLNEFPCELDKKKPIIYAFNHSNANDIPLAEEIIGTHNYLLASNENEKDITGLLFKMKGVVFLDRNDYVSKKKAKVELIKRALADKSILIFPEGTWNLEESLPMLDLAYGVIELAKISGFPILPIVMEYEDKKDTVYVKYGKPLYINYRSGVKESKDALRDEMASLKYDIWESSPIINREDFDEKRYEEWKKELVSAYPKATPEEIRNMAIKAYETYDDVMPITVNKLTLKL